MDEWVPEDRFLSTEEAPDLEEDEEPAGNQGRLTRNQRRKLDDQHGIPVLPSTNNRSYPL